VLDLPINPVDVGILLLIGIAAVLGFRAGLISGTYSLASWIIAAASGFAFMGPATALVLAATPLPKQLAVSLGFIAVVALVEGLFAVAGHLAVRPIVALVRRSPLNMPDRILGVVPAVGRSLFIVAVAITALVSLPVASDLKATVETSRFGRIVSAQLAVVQPQLAALASQLGGGQIVLTKIGEEETEKLDLPDGLQLSPDPVAERQLFELVNDERTHRGLAALQLDERLLPVARQHSEEMFRLKYFSHQSPVSGSPFDRMDKAKIPRKNAGENLAYAQSVAVAHQGLMESPGHRANILRPEYTRIGIGVISAGAYGKMFTQLFLTPP
jgi:uncharacterized protein YkwD